MRTKKKILQPDAVVGGEEGYISKNRGVDVQKTIAVHIIFNGEETKGWLHTHGMASFGMPELEMRNIPLFLANPACSLINAVCDYMLNTDGKKFLPGQILQFGTARFFLNQSNPIPGDEEHFKHDRWMFEDVERKCPHCEADPSKPHIH